VWTKGINHPQNFAFVFFSFFVEQARNIWWGMKQCDGGGGFFVGLLTGSFLV
jgi:hypothetical protein